MALLREIVVFPRENFYTRLGRIFIVTSQNIKINFLKISATSSATVSHSDNPFLLWLRHFMSNQWQNGGISMGSPRNFFGKFQIFENDF